MTTAGQGVDRRAVTEWLNLLYEGTRGYAHIACTRNWAGRTFQVDPVGIEAAARYVGVLERTAPAGIYARITTLFEPPRPNADGRRRRGGRALAASLPALWADLDVAGPGHRHTLCEGGATCQHLAGGGSRRLHAGGPVLPLPPDEDAARAVVAGTDLPEPTLWIHSGGGLYPIWLIDPVHQITDDLAELGALSAGWQEVIAASAARAGWHYGTGVGDLARVLRIPGTWNRKTDDPRMCRILQDDRPGPRYALAELAARLEYARRLLPTPVPAVVPERRAPVDRPDSGGLRPGDDFAARVDWADPLLLGVLGWTVVRQEGTYREWLRQGAHSDLTATTGRDGKDNLWVFSTETPFPTNEVISKFEAFRIIHGYPTHREATQALGRLGFGASAGNGSKPPRAPLEPLLWPEGATLDRPTGMSANGAQRPAQPVEVGDVAAVLDRAPAGHLPLDPWEVDQPPEVAPDEAPDGDDEDEADTWEPVDLGPYLRGEVVRPAPAVGLIRTDGVRLLYPGKEHAVIGEMEAGKGWFALLSAVTEMLAGNHVVYVHFEEADPGDTVERLVALGADDELILALFHFVGPAKPIKPKQRKRLAGIGATLVVLDGVNEGMNLHKLGIRDEDGAAEFRRIMVKPFTRRGAAVLSCDHVIKDRETRDRYALGSIHKGNALDGALIVLENADPFGRGLRGRSHVYATKDRPGHLRRSGVPTKLPGKTFMGELVVDDTRTLHDALSVTFFAPTRPDEGALINARADAEDTVDELVVAAVRSLNRRDLPATFRNVRAETGVAQIKVRDAADRLIVSGRVVEIEGYRRSKVLMLVEPEGSCDVL